MCVLCCVIVQLKAARTQLLQQNMELQQALSEVNQEKVDEENR
jgi:hypothetical protein